MGFEIIVALVAICVALQISAVYNPDVVTGRLVEDVKVTKRDREILRGRVQQAGEKPEGWILSEEQAKARVWSLRKEIEAVEREIANCLAIIARPRGKDLAFAKKVLSELKAEKRRLVARLPSAKKARDEALVEVNPIAKALREAGLK